MFSAIGLDLGFAAGLLLFGWFIARLADPDSSGTVAAAFAFPLGSGVLTLALFLLSMLGMPLTSGTIAATLALGVAALALALWRRRREPLRAASPRTERARWKIRDVLPLSVIFLLFLISLAVSMGRAYSTWDAAAIWGVKGYGIAHERTVQAGADWGSYGLTYPLNLPLQIAGFVALDGDVIPGSKLIPPLFYGSLALALIGYFRTRRATLGAWAALFLIATPIVFDHATQAYANLPFAVYIVLGTLLAIEGTTTGRRGAFVLSGLGLGMAIWTRPEGLILVGALYATIFAATRVLPSSIRPDWVWLIPAVVVGGIWIAFSLTNGETTSMGGMLGNAAAAVRSGRINLGAFYWIGRYFLRDLFRPSVWGVLLPALVLGAYLHLRGRTRTEEWILLSTAIAASVLILAFYYLVSFSGNLEWWLDTGLSRMLMPGGLLLALWAVSPWAGQRSRSSGPEQRGATDA
jgi:hypothetical protein